MKKRIPYGVADYAKLVRQNSYFVDKTPYFEKLETVNNPVFLRPRRFGKSLFCSMLYYYYDLNSASRFEELFGHTWIGQHPTEQHNQFLVLSLDFSRVAVGSSLPPVEHHFNRYGNDMLAVLQQEYAQFANHLPELLPEEATCVNLGRLLNHIRVYRLPPLYVIIDEYDNFSNQWITTHQDYLYRELTASDSFLKTFFKTLKEGCKTGAVTNIFITGVLPLMIDDIASGYNIASFLTLDSEFEAMLGFTQADIHHLLTNIYQDYQITSPSREAVEVLLKNHYNGYHFVNGVGEGEALYNSTLVMYFLNHLCRHQRLPEQMTDANLKTDISWVRRLTASSSELTQGFVDQCLLHNQVGYDQTLLLEKFNLFQFIEPAFFPVAFFYLGMLTKHDDFTLKLPNLNMQAIFVSYFNELHHIDVSTRYTAMMQRFVQSPNLEELFAGYWEHYVSQLPEAIFTQVNENFYRTTFFELCSRYLSRWFLWHVERSYPQGKSDLEFVGKHHEKFAGLRWVIEFKYFSNAEFKKFKTSLDQWSLRVEDTQQIAGYSEGLKAEYPEAQITQFVIYCVGNQGFRVFQV